MALQKGRQQYIAIADESTRLTAETTGFKYLTWTSLTAPGNENAYLMDESAFANRGKLLNKVLVNQHAVCNWQGYIDADNLLLPLYAIFGTATPTTALGATTWAISLNQSIEAKTFTVQYETNQEGDKKINGWMASKLDLEFGVDSSTYTLEGTGIQETDGTNLTATYTQPNKYLLGRHVALSYATTKAGLTSGTAITEVRSAKVSFETGLDIARHKTLGSLAPSNVSQDGFSAVLEFTRISDKAQTSDFQDWSDAGTARAFRLDVTASNLSVIGTSALKPRLLIDFEASTVTSVREIPIDDYIIQTITVEISQPDATAVTLINEIATA